MGNFQKLQITCTERNENVLALFFENVVILKEKKFPISQSNSKWTIINVIPLIGKKINLHKWFLSKMVAPQWMAACRLATITCLHYFHSHGIGSGP